MTTQEVINKYLNTAVEAEDPSNLDQCMDWVFKYLDEMGIPRETIRHLFAFQAYTQPNDTTLKYFELVPNTPNGIPQAGDIPIFGTKVGVAGHICVATGDGDANTFKSADQNWNGHKYVEYINHPYDAVLGWLHPRTPATSPQPIPQEITDSTKIPQLGNQEVQAIRSSITAKDQHITDLTITNNQQVSMIEDLRKQLSDCNNKPVSPQNPPISVHVDPQPSWLSDFFKRLFG